MSDPAPDDVTSWHDHPIYDLHLRCADPECDIWRSELVFDVDHILEWRPQPGKSVLFLMVPTVLVFHDVSDLAVAIDFGFAAGRRLNLNELSVRAITREPVLGEGPAYYYWHIALNHPAGGVNAGKKMHRRAGVKMHHGGAGECDAKLSFPVRSKDPAFPSRAGIPLAAARNVGDGRSGATRSIASMASTGPSP